MDDCNLFLKNEKKINILVSTVRAISKNNGMEFGIRKGGMLVLKRGRVIKSQEKRMDL